MNQQLLFILLGGIKEHDENGSPEYWSKHRQIGWWTLTVHVVYGPQAPAHGSLHSSLMQAKFPGHSAFRVHSGRQFGGRPMYFGVHEQTAVSSLTTRHCEFGPQGDGTHGLVGCVGAISEKSQTDFYWNGELVETNYEETRDRLTSS